MSETTASAAAGNVAACRIHVGGLGAAVTEDDLRNTFSALGAVAAVDVVRTKGRSFAYLDFVPSSDKSLAKLFSTYNGCMWKGGRLRLEKAKEHYLLRLKREWQEEAEREREAEHARDKTSCKLEASDNIGFSQKPKKIPSTDEKQIRIFFPKLRKVKPLSLNGTGKHKYSFQRVAEPSLPKHFCDCEEHSGSYLVAKERHPSLVTKERPVCAVETADGGINEEELNIMSSVMNKLFERERRSESANREAEFESHGDNCINLHEGLLTVNNRTPDVSDEDDLIINVVASNKSRNSSSGGLRQETIKAIQEPVNKLQTSRRKQSQNIHDRRKANAVTDGMSDEHNAVNFDEDLPPGDNVTLAISDEDDMLINVVGSNNNRNSSSGGFRQETFMATEEAVNMLQTSKHKQSKNIRDDQKNAVPRSKKGAPYTEESNRNETAILEVEGNMNAQAVRTAKTDLGTQQAKSLKKSSWKDKIDQNSKTPFSISDITPSVSVRKQEQLGTNELVSSSATHVEKEEEPTTVDQVLSSPDLLNNNVENRNAENQSSIHKDEEEPRTDDPVLPSADMVNGNLENRNAESHLSILEDDEKLSEVPPAKQDETMSKSGRGASWLHKSSWTQLVASTTNSPFSLSQVLPGLPSGEHEPQLDSIQGKMPTEDCSVASQEIPHASNVVPSTKNDPNPADVTAEQTSKEEQQVVRKDEVFDLPLLKNEPSTSQPLKKESRKRKQPSFGSFEVGETCSFMRSDASMKEWKKVKASLSTSFKKKDEGKAK